MIFIMNLHVCVTRQIECAVYHGVGKNDCILHFSASEENPLATQPLCQSCHVNALFCPSRFLKTHILRYAENTSCD